MAAGCLSFAAVGIALIFQILPAQATSASNLVGYWKFDESTAGATATDSSGNGNNLTPVNSPAPTTDIPGAMNAAIPDSHSASFNGSTQYFTVADNSSLDSTGAVSVSTWVKFNNTSGNQTIMAKWQVGVHQQWVLQLNSGHISWWTGDGYSGANELASSTAITAGTWYHLVATATSGSKQLYINGTLDASNTAGAMGVAAGTPLTIGSKPSSSGTFFEYLNGEVDDARVYSRVLSDTEASSLATGSEANTLTGGSAITNELGSSSAITDLQVTSTATDPTVYVKMYVGQGTISLDTATGLTFYGADGSSLGSSQPANSASLHIGGSLSDVNADLATLHYKRTGTSTGSDTLSASLVGPGEAFFSGNDHSYQYVAGPVTWSQAETAAAASSKYGAQGYLATITSQAENDFIATQLKSDSWIGASDSAVEGTWRWVTGPESGEQFWQGSGSGNTVNSMYAHWNNPVTGGTGQEPNDSGGNEDCAEFYYSNNGLWNDLNCSSTLGYIIEYGGLSGINPTVSTATVAITTADSTAPSAPGKPTVTPASPTTTTTPSLSWSAATDTGTGLASPAYTVEWSQDPTFATISGSTTASSPSSYTFGTPLADGTWYFRVVAADIAGNAAASAASDALVIDTTGPVVDSLTPADDASNAAIDGNLTVQFNEPVVATAGDIVIHKTSDNSVVETIKANSSQVVGSGTSILTIFPSADFAYDTGYYVTIASSTVADGLGNAYAGISSASTWNFTTTKAPAQLALEKIEAYADSDGAGTAPTETDYTTAGVQGVSADNLALLNSYVASSSSSDVSDAADIQTFADKAAAITVIQQYAGSHGGTATPTVSNYTTAGVTGVTSANLTAINQVVAAAGSANLDSPELIQSLVASALAPRQPSAATRQTAAASDGSTADDNSASGTPQKEDTIRLNNATEKPGQAGQKDANGKNTGAFLGLGWWWLPLLAILAYLWFLLAGRRRKHDREQS